MSRPPAHPRRRSNGATPPPEPPWSLEAEEALLGALLTDGASWGSISGMLSAADFYRGDHRVVYRAIAELAAAGKPIDLITVDAYLTDAGSIEDVGGYAPPERLAAYRSAVCRRL